MSYRTRRFLRRFFTVLLTVLVIGALVWGCWMIWVQRHVIYTNDGVKIDFSRTAADLTGEEALPPVPGATVAIHYVDSAEFQDDTTDELTQILGYVVTTDALLHDFDAVQTQVAALPPGTAVMVDVDSRDTQPPPSRLDRQMIHPVTLVPISAPRIMAMAQVSPSTPPWVPSSSSAQGVLYMLAVSGVAVASASMPTLGKI